jgi:tetratricopeptide (TPR) repeat protein
MTDVFISYARADRSWTERLDKVLRKNGFSVWWDHDLTPGHEFSDEIEKALQAAKSVIVIWSEHSAASTFVRDEARIAKDFNKLIPVRAPDFDPRRLPMGFGALQTLLVTDRDGILKRVGALSGREWNPPPETIGRGFSKWLNHTYHAHRWPILSIGGLALAAGLGIFVYLNEQEKLCEGVPKENLRTTMWGNIQKDYLEFAETQAKQLLRCDPHNVSGLAGMGAITFYQASYTASANWFGKALAERPHHQILPANLADALVEAGRYEEALESLALLDQSKQSTQYKLGRAHLLSGSYKKSREVLTNVATSFGEEARAGKARILEAAAEFKMTDNVTGAAREMLLKSANEHLKIGISQDSEYWEDLLAGRTKNKNEPFGEIGKIIQHYRSNALQSGISPF